MDATAHFQEILRYRTENRGVTNITADVERLVTAQGGDLGIVTLHCMHTSASLLIQENSDPDVIRDLEAWFGRIAPRGDPMWTHRQEGPDDMPAHVRAALTQTSMTIPFDRTGLRLGQWQAIYLYEHRDGVHERSIVAHVLGHRHAGN
ncbi:MAG: YjbQ family protein [Planctomycetes bacterium]|nr:YjbQ family protein [Planctomycetota bacterium]